MITEVDEATYASAQHRNSAPSGYLLNGELLRYEALGVMQRLVRNARPDMTDEAMHAELASRVELRKLEPPKTSQQAQAAQDAARARTEERTYKAVEQLAFAGAGPMPEFIHRTGAEGCATTRVCAASRYGACYHMFHEMQTAEELTADLARFARRERARRLRAAAAGGLFQALQELTEEERLERAHLFAVWNAAVADACLLGGGGSDGMAMAAYEDTPAAQLPALLTRPAEPAPGDIPLHPQAAAVLGKFLLRAGNGHNLHLDRALIREQLRQLASSDAGGAPAGGQAALDARAQYLVRKAWAFGPWLALQGGKELVDAPGTADPTPLHRRQLRAAIEGADHLILVGETNVEAPQGTLEALADCGALERFYGETLQLSVVHNHEKRHRGLASFQGRDASQVEVAANKSKSALTLMLRNVLRLTRPGEPATVAALQGVVERCVRVLTVYSLLYAGLKLCPDKAAAVLGDQLDSVLEATQGAQLLALLEWLNLENVCESVEKLAAGPLAGARAALAALLARLDAPAVSDALRNRARGLIKPTPSSLEHRAKQGIRSAIRDTFMGTPAAPFDQLRQAIRDAKDAFDAAVRAELQGPVRQRTDAAWNNAARLFLDNPKRALDAHAAVSADGTGPHGMDLHNLLCSGLTLPAGAQAALATAVDDAVEQFVKACTAMLMDQLPALAGADAA